MAAVRRRRRALVDFSSDKKKLFDIALTKKKLSFITFPLIYAFFPFNYFSALL